MSVDQGRLSREQRVTASVWAGVSGFGLGLARWLRPDGRGFGTHEQLGLGACKMIEYLGVPCPFCGMTTAWAYAARGQFVDAALTQLAGSILFLVAVASVPVGLWMGITGRRVGWVDRVTGSIWTWIGFGAVALGSWAVSVGRFGGFLP